MSTAIERIMRERGDCTCFHEPFMYDYYVHRAVRAMPHFDIEPDRPLAYGKIRDHLLAAADSTTVFLKDMSYYVVPALFEDISFARRVTHAFLIRDPLRAILSYHKLDPGVTLEEIGLEAQWRQFAWLRDSEGLDPVVVEAETVRRTPQAAMRAFWNAIGLPFMDHAFAWSDEDAPADWGQVAGWHGTVSSSGKIKPITAEENREARSRFDAATSEAPWLKDYLAHHQPFYDRLRACALHV